MGYSCYVGTTLSCSYVHATAKLEACSANNRAGLYNYMYVTVTLGPEWGYAFAQTR